MQGSFTGYCPEVQASNSVESAIKAGGGYINADAEFNIDKPPIISSGFGGRRKSKIDRNDQWKPK